MSGFISNGKSGKDRKMAWVTQDSIKVKSGSTKVSIPKPTPRKNPLKPR